MNIASRQSFWISGVKGARIYVQSMENLDMRFRKHHRVSVIIGFHGEAASQPAAQQQEMVGPDRWVLLLICRRLVSISGGT